MHGCLCRSNPRRAGFHGEGALRVGQELRRLREGAALGTQYGLLVAAGHGLTYRNVGAVAAFPEVTEFNIGHNIIARSIFVGLERAVRRCVRLFRPEAITDAGRVFQIPVSQALVPKRGRTSPHSKRATALTLGRVVQSSNFSVMLLRYVSYAS